MYKQIFDDIKKQLNAIPSSEDDKINSLLKSKEFDFNWISKGISEDIDNFTLMNSPQGLFNTMCSALGVACGMFTEVRYPALAKCTKPNLFTVLVGQSASGKDPLFDYVLKDTIRMKDKEVYKKWEKKVEDWESKKVEGERIPPYLKRPAGCTAGDVTRPVLIANLRYNAILSYHTELDDFFSIHRPRKEDDNMGMITAIFSDYEYKVSRMDTEDGNRNADDIMLSMVIGAQPGIAKELFSRKYMDSGASYRFLLAFAKDKECISYEKNGFEMFLEMEKNKKYYSNASNFKFIFDKVFNTFYEGYSKEKRNTFDFSVEGLKTKTETVAILKQAELAFAENGKNLKRIMVTKLHTYIDKFSLLIQILKDNDKDNVSFVSSLSNPSLASLNREIDSESVMLAFLYCRTIFENWQQIAGDTLNNSDNHSKELDEMRKASQIIRIDYIKLYQALYLAFPTGNMQQFPKVVIDKICKDNNITKGFKKRALEFTEEKNGLYTMKIDILSLQKEGLFGTFDEEIKKRTK